MKIKESSTSNACNCTIHNIMSWQVVLAVCTGSFEYKCTFVHNSCRQQSYDSTSPLTCQNNELYWLLHRSRPSEMNNSSLDWLDHTPCRDVGIRFHPTRGAMSVGKSQGGKAPDSICQAEDVILADMERFIQEFHDASRWRSSFVHIHCLYIFYIVHIVPFCYCRALAPLRTHFVCTWSTLHVAAMLVPRARNLLC